MAGACMYRCYLYLNGERPLRTDKKMSKCQMCGKESTKVTNRWYQYDNGERFIASVCASCADLHLSLMQKAGA